jgi:Na+-translocating ferredoxin:NAD+ oxidoreductase subunit C
MMLKTFNKGGVHPEENKLSSGSPIQYLPVPAEVQIALGQSLGAPAKAIVTKGDSIKTGQLIARGEAFISANVHSSVSGKVLKIEDVDDQSGYRRQAVIIAVEGDDWMDSIDRESALKRECRLSSAEIIEKIHEMGIVGLGGATFPTKVKMMVPQGKKPEILILNGVECEPYLTADHRLMLEKGEEILVGATILMKALSVKKAVIGIENNKPDAIAHLGGIAKNYPGIEIIPLKVKYPQGAEKQLIKAVTGREVPSMKLPIEVGCVVNNVGTAFAVYEAVQKNKPLFERVVTVTGKHFANPANYMTRIGTPIIQLIEHAGGIPEGTGKVVSGGPMMGKALNSLKAPVLKGTSGILMFDSDEARRASVKHCIRCGRCVTACPMGLEPYLLEKQVNNLVWEDAEANRIMDCMECGSCHYICPSSRPLLDYMRLGKSKVGQIMRTRVNK